MNRLISGVGMPDNLDEKSLNMLHDVAAGIGVDPAAIALIINMESGWNPRNSTGSYNGLTQIGRVSFSEAGGTLAGLNYNEFRNAPRHKQIEVYGEWLKFCGFLKQFRKLDIDLTSMTIERQAAVLQGFQFSPYGQRYKVALAKGNIDVPATPAQQARVLGSTSIRDMEKAFRGRIKNDPPVYESDSIDSIDGAIEWTKDDDFKG